MRRERYDDRRPCQEVLRLLRNPAVAVEHNCEVVTLDRDFAGSPQCVTLASRPADALPLDPSCLRLPEGHSTAV